MNTETVVEQPTTALAPVDRGSPLPVFRGQDMAQALTAYKELQRALDQSMPDQLMELDGKAFRKKGYWRAVAVAFNLTVEPVDERREVNNHFADGRENFGYVVTYRATAPNGRTEPGDGACFAIEKARRFRCPHPERPGSTRTLHWPAESCPDFDPDFQWRTLPAQATEHNVRSHAHTRAFNRAVSNLVGFGEVSAEEVDREEAARDQPAERQTMRQPQRREHAAGPDTGSGPVHADMRTGDTIPGDVVSDVSDEAVYITSIDEKTGTGRNGKDYVKFTITDSRNRQYGTFSQSLAKVAAQCRDRRTLVILNYETTQYGKDLTDIVIARGAAS